MTLPVEIYVRRAEPDDAASLAKVEVTTWRIAYQGLMPASFLDQILEANKTANWYSNASPPARSQL